MAWFNEQWKKTNLEELERWNLIKIGRGKVISKNDINKFVWDYPIYSSSIHNNWEFGKYGLYMFDEEMITWSIDWWWNFFYRPKHKYSVTNVGWYIKVTTKDINTKFLTILLQSKHKNINFDYTSKAHPSIIRKAYNFFLPSIEEQNKIAEIFTDIEKKNQALRKKREKYTLLKQGMMQELLTGNIRVYGHS